MGPVIGGQCRVRKSLLVAAVVLRAGLVAWIRADNVVRRMRTAVPIAFGVAGPLIYAVVHGWPSMTIELRDASGAEVSQVRVGGSGIRST